MPKRKTNNFIEVFKIFFKSIKTYFVYLDQTSKALLFPLLGQLLSVIAMFALAYLFNTNFDTIQKTLPFLNSEVNILVFLIIVFSPFVIIFAKAFYDYIILFSSLNLVYYTHSYKKKVKNVDFNSYNNSIQRRLFNYIVLMIIIIPSMIIAPFMCLAYQIFAMESDVSPWNAIKRSFSMVKSNFIPSLIMLVLCYVVTYKFLPDLFIWFSRKISLYYFMVSWGEKFASLLPFSSITNQVDLGILNDVINEMFSPIKIAKDMASSIISFLVVGFTLPFRCCCFTELYRIFDSKKIKENSKMTDEIVKRAVSKKQR